MPRWKIHAWLLGRSVNGQACLVGWWSDWMASRSSLCCGLVGGPNAWSFSLGWLLGGLVADWSLTQRACWWLCWWSDCLHGQSSSWEVGYSEVVNGWPFSFAWSFSLVWWVGFGRLVVDWSLNQRVSWWVVWMAKSAD